MEGLAKSFELLSDWGPSLLEGLENSAYVAVGGYLLGLIIGLFGAQGKLRGGPVVRDLLEIYTTVVRAVPELILILILFYIGSNLINQAAEVLGFGRIEVSRIGVGILVIGFVQGAYATEILRGAIKAIPIGQLEAASAYGMSSMLTLRRVTIPAMLAFAIPGLANLWLLATKDTALLSVVSLNELTLATKQAAGTTKAYITFYLAAGAIYLTITLISGYLFKYIENWARKGQPKLSGDR